MRGSESGQVACFLSVDLEDRVPAKHLLRAIRRIVNDVLTALDGDYADSGRAVNSTGAAASHASVAGVLHNPLRNAADGATPLQPAVPLVRRSRCRRAGVVPTVFTKNRERLLEAEVSSRPSSCSAGSHATIMAAYDLIRLSKIARSVCVTTKPGLKSAVKSGQIARLSSVQR